MAIRTEMINIAMPQPERGGKKTAKRQFSWKGLPKSNPGGGLLHCSPCRAGMAFHTETGPWLANCPRETSRKKMGMPARASIIR